jgi:hypothetical protein
MNKENAKEFLPLVQALAEGKIIQWKRYADEGGEWEDFEHDVEIQFCNDLEDYRIKPEPRTFEIVRGKVTGSIYDAKDWGGTSLELWERITVQEVLE